MDACLACRVNYMDTANTSRRIPRILNTAGSGPTVTGSATRALRHCLAAVLTPRDGRILRLCPKAPL